MGVLSVSAAQRRRPFTLGQVKALSILTNLAATALDNAALYTQVRQSEERFRSVTESAMDAIISADSNGTILSWNHGAQRLFGYARDEMVGQPFTLLDAGPLPWALSRRGQTYLWQRVSRVLWGKRSKCMDLPGTAMNFRWNCRSRVGRRAIAHFSARLSVTLRNGSASKPNYARPRRCKLSAHSLGVLPTTSITSCQPSWAMPNSP